MKSYLKTTSLGLFLISIFFIQCTSGGNSDKIQKQLRSEIDDINKKCPMQINTSIRIDSCVLFPNNDMEYFYTITDSIPYTASQFGEIQETVKNATKNDPGMADIRSYGVSTRYNYRDTNGDIVFTFKVTPEDYK
jgi:hypothetical protein